MDRWKSFPIQCQGGLRLDLDSLTQATQYPGSALILQNYEPALEGGYKRILGYSKFDDDQVPGTGAVLGVKVALDGVIACRKSGTSYDLSYSSAAGWTKINSATRLNTVNKMRGVLSSITVPAVILLDGANYALKWDGTIDTLINGTGAPADPRYGAVYKNRLVLAGYSSDPQEISISEPGSDTLFDGGAGAMSIPCFDIIVGLKTFREELYIYCVNSIWKLTGSDTSDFAIVNITNSIGCVSGDTICELGGDLIFLAPDGFRSTAATARIGDVELGLVSRAIQPIIREELTRALDKDTYSGVVIRAKSQYRLYLNQDSIPAENQTGVLGKLTGRADNNGALEYQWSTLSGVQPYCADSAYTNNQEYCVIGSNSDGYVHRLEQGTSFDGDNIKAIYRSPDLVFDDVTLRKVYQKAQINTQVEGDFTASLNVYLDYADPAIQQPGPLVIAQSGSLTTYGTGIYDTSIYGVLSYPVFRKNLVGSGFTMAFQFTSDGTDASHRIDDFTITYALKSFR